MFYSAEEIAQEWGSRYKITASGSRTDLPWLAAMIIGDLSVRVICISFTRSGSTKEPKRYRRKL